MEKVPESTSAAELLPWIAFERDAAWAAKLAILRAQHCDEIAHLGRCLREHDRHADELVQFARTMSPGLEVPAEPAFVTRDASIVGNIAKGDEALLDAVERLEAVRIGRYETRRRPGAGEPGTVLDGLLERHLTEARARIVALRQVRSRHAAAA